MSAALATPDARVARRPAAAPAWAAVAAWGGGLIEVALGAGAVTGDEATPAVIASGAVLVVLGVAGLAWGAATLARGRVIAPRAGIAGALAGVVVAALAVAADPARVSVITAAAASVLLIVVAGACGSRLRALARGAETDAAAPRIAVLLVAAVLVAGIVTPALGATEAARLAPDHGSHGFSEPGHH
ncbi:MAG: hypothetical protein ABWY55_13310 [Microbacterium sp.]